VKTIGKVRWLSDRLALYVMVASLNVIRCLTGSQCKSRRASVAPAETAVQYVLGDSGLTEACPSYIQMFPEASCYSSVT